MARRLDLLEPLPNEILNAVNAIEKLRRAKRIVVIGCSGGGKSTLSKQLSSSLDLAYVPMDRDVFWLPGWKKRDKQSQREILAKIVAQDRWVIDGSGKSNFDIRLPRTDIIIWLHLPRWQCLLSVYQRAFRFLGRVRSELADGCPEKWPDREFISYIWQFEKLHLPTILEEISKHGPQIPIIWLTSRSETNKLIDQIKQSALKTPYAEV